jgi:hypothetical protein
VSQGLKSGCVGTAIFLSLVGALLVGFGQLNYHFPGSPVALFILIRVFLLHAAAYPIESDRS